MGPIQRSNWDTEKEPLIKDSEEEVEMTCQQRTCFVVPNAQALIHF